MTKNLLPNFPAGVLAVIFSIVQAKQRKQPEDAVQETINDGGDRWHVDLVGGKIVVKHLPDQNSVADLQDKLRRAQESRAELEIRARAQWDDTDPDAERKQKAKDAAKDKLKELNKQIGGHHKAINKAGERSRWELDVAAMAAEKVWTVSTEGVDSGGSDELQALRSGVSSIWAYLHASFPNIATDPEFEYMPADEAVKTLMGRLISANKEHTDLDAAAKSRAENEVDRLTEFLIENYPDEVGAEEGSVDVAMRLLAPSGAPATGADRSDEHAENAVGSSTVAQATTE